MTDAVITVFKNATLNQIGAQIIENYGAYHENSQVAKEHLKMAIVRRFINGQLIDKHYYEIVEECGSQRAFGEEIGVSEAMISNDLRAYRACAERGADTPEKLLDLLQSKNLRSTTYEWERLPKLLNEPESYREPDRRAKDEKRLEEIEKELSEIRQRNESASNNHIEKLAQETSSELKELKGHLDKLDPLSYDWKSRKYIDWAKSLGWDFINDCPAENLEFHHTDMRGGSGGVGTKLPDVFGLPTTIQTHAKIEDGKYEVPPMQLASGLIKLMSLFIMNQFDNV